MDVWETSRGGCEVVWLAVSINLVLLRQENEATVYVREHG